MPKKEVFTPKPGQVDFTNARFAPVINCVLTYKGKILLVKRSQHLRFYPGYWNGISGFLDDKKTLTQKVAEELREELGLPKSKIKKIRLGEIFHQDAPKYKKTWIVHPILVEVSTHNIMLDWEADTFVWVLVRDVKKMKLLPGFDGVIKRISEWV